MDKHQEFKKKWLGKWFCEDSKLWTQCVWWVKIYAYEVFGISLKVFWWSAYNGWKTWNPFKWFKFVKIENTASFIPKVWDIVFFDKHKSNWNYGHVWIVDELTTVKNLFVLNQNMWTWTGHGKWDWFRISKFDYISPKCLGVYRFLGK